MRLDRLLCYLRVVRTRSRAQALVEAGHIRRNGLRVERASQPIAPGDVLTLPLGRTVRVIAIDRLPKRRGPAAEAQTCYRELDPEGQSAIAAGQTANTEKDTEP